MVLAGIHPNYVNSIEPKQTVVQLGSEMTTIASQKQFDQKLERLARWSEDGTIIHVDGKRFNTVIDCHGKAKGYRYHHCQCKKCTTANTKYNQELRNNRK